ncbi:MAG: S-methyl-5'-thioadenosine phosphorylase [Deltaproteobacteria bacterium]|nr:S-methyl-5'-thioadenosine phosphorylase [Deltaproteobacteria bacterium]
MTNATIAVIGGSGLYDLAGLEDVEEKNVSTPFGPPSDAVVSGRLGRTRMLFLARHGRGHRLTPSEVNYRANIFALKSLGAERVIAVSAVGSMREDVHPGDIVVVDQFIDRTRGRPSTFFGNGIVGHVSLADPVCADLAGRVFDAAVSLGLTAHRGGTYMCMEGPAFSTRAESRMHRAMGVTVIGMTNMPEAKLAREAELCYATVALATDYDCWHETEEDVTVEAVIRIVRQNAANARAVIRKVVEGLSDERPCACARALDSAIITDRRAIPADVKERMKPVFGRVL